MKKVGFWKDTRDPDWFDDLPNPVELGLARITQATLDKIADYLAAGRVHERYMGYSYCRFDCGVDDSDMGSADLTDGAYIWPEGLAHYVRVHDVVLPKEFMEHVLARVGK